MPTVRQRLIVSLAILLGALPLLWLRGLLGAADGSQGISLLTARTGAVPAVGLIVARLVPAVALGWLAAGTGSLLAGPFVLGGALAIVAAAAGPMDDYLRSMPMPGGYWRLAGESLIWLAIWSGFLAGMVKLAPWWRGRLPKACVSEVWEPLPVSISGWRPWAGGLLCAAVAAASGLLLIRSSDMGQVLASIFIGFCLGGLAARSALGPISPIIVLLSPALVAVGSYAWFGLAYGGWHEVLSTWYRQRLAGLGMALPIHYFSVGVAGAALGIGWGQMLAAPKAAEAK